MKHTEKDWLPSALQGVFGHIAGGLFLVLAAVISFFLVRDCSNNQTIQTSQESNIQVTARFKMGDRVISQNTTDDKGNEGVKIRSTPQILPDNHQGWLFDGATGEIIEGPGYDDTYIWWKVAWDAGLGGSKILCGNTDPCTGWTAETINNALILKKL